MSLCLPLSFSYSLLFFSLFVFYVYCVDPFLYPIAPLVFYSIQFYSILRSAFFLLNPPPASPFTPPQTASPWCPLTLLTGQCALWSSWRCPSMAATGPTWRPPRLAPTWPGSWRSTPRCPSITQASTLKCSGSACLLQRCPPVKPHPKPSKVRFLWCVSGCDGMCQLSLASQLPVNPHLVIFFRRAGSPIFLPLDRGRLAVSLSFRLCAVVLLVSITWRHWAVKVALPARTYVHYTFLVYSMFFTLLYPTLRIIWSKVDFLSSCS